MDSLPDDVLLEIFERLDEDSLEKATKVCKRWSQLITSSTPLMKRFTLTIVVSCDQSFRVYGKVDSKIYQNLVIKSVLKPFALSKEFFEYLGNYRETARNLTLNEFLLSDVALTLKHLNLEKITKLVLIKCEFNLRRGAVIAIPNLTHLELHSSKEFVSVIRVHCVKVLKISNPDHHIKSIPQNVKFLNSTLQTCRNLKELTLSKFNAFSVTIKLNINEFKFNLVSFTVESSSIVDLEQFLLSQKSSLRNLAISCKYRDVQLLKVILNDLELTQLEIDTTIMPENFSFINKNTTVKKLIIRNEESSHYRNRINFERQIVNARDAAHRLRHEQINSIDDYQNSPRQLNEPPDWNHLHRHVLNRLFEGGLHVNFATYDLSGRNIPRKYKRVQQIIAICSAVEEFSNRDFDFSAETLLTQIHHSMANLNILKLLNVPNNIPTDVNFDKLQCFEICRIDHAFEFVNLATLISQCVDIKIVKVRKLDTRTDPMKIIRTIAKKAPNLKEIHLGYLTFVMKYSIKIFFENKRMKNIKFYYNSNDTSIDDENKLGQMKKEMIDRMKKLEESDKYPLNVIR